MREPAGRAATKGTPSPQSQFPSGTRTARGFTPGFGKSFKAEVLKAPQPDSGARAGGGGRGGYSGHRALRNPVAEHSGQSPDRVTPFG